MTMPTSAETTEPGRAAYKVLRWVQEDPAGRAAEGLDRLDEIAASADGDDEASMEVSGVYGYLSKYLPD